MSDVIYDNEESQTNTEDSTDVQDSQETQETTEVKAEESAESESTEAKESEEKGEEKAESDEEKAEAKGDEEADIKYELSLPEESLITKEDLAAVEVFAKENKLTNEQAQKLVDSKHEAVTNFHESQKEQVEETQAAWVEQIKEDSEIGGTNFEQSIEFAKRALGEFASDDLKEQLDSTGFGNHPELVRTFARIGKRMADDSFVHDGKLAKAPKNAADVIYGNNN